MPIYNKLIRDRIPELIKETGGIALVEVLEDKDYILELNKKLKEELDEYYEDQSVDELADMVEVIYAILKYKGVPIHKFEEIRKNKAEKRGGFQNKLYLREVKEAMK